MKEQKNPSLLQLIFNAVNEWKKTGKLPNGKIRKPEDEEGGATSYEK